MYARTVFFKTVKPNDRITLTEFFHAIAGNSMYNSMTEELISTPGFLRKELMMIDSKDGCYTNTRVIFEDKDSFDKYVTNDTYEMIWEYLQISAEGVGILVTFEDQGVDKL
jgi:hypothetical protein